MTVLINIFHQTPGEIFHEIHQTPKISLLNRVLSRIYRLGEKSRVAEGHELPREVRGGLLPRKFLEMNMR